MSCRGSRAARTQQWRAKKREMCWVYAAPNPTYAALPSGRLMIANRAFLLQARMRSCALSHRPLDEPPQRRTTTKILLASRTCLRSAARRASRARRLSLRRDGEVEEIKHGRV